MTPTRTPESTASSTPTPSYSSTGFGYLMATAPTLRAAANPASEEPETKIPEDKSGDNGGVIFSSDSSFRSLNWSNQHCNTVTVPHIRPPLLMMRHARIHLQWLKKGEKNSRVLQIVCP